MFSEKTLKDCGSSTRPIVSHIEEHHFRVLKVKHANGRIETEKLRIGCRI